MKQPTHYIEIAIGVDFAEIFSPERIQGVKFLLGAQSDEEVISMLAHNMVSDVTDSLGKHNGFAEIVNADIKAVPAQNLDVEGLEEPENNQEIDEGLGETDSDGLDVVETFLDEDNRTSKAEDVDVDAEADVESDEPESVDFNTEELSYDSYSNELIREMGDDIFRIRAYLGDIIGIYIRRHSEYGETVLNEFGEDAPIFSFNDLKSIGDNLEDVETQDYVIRYKVSGGEVKYGKRKLVKEEENI